MIRHREYRIVLMNWGGIGAGLGGTEVAMVVVAPGGWRASLQAAEQNRGDREVAQGIDFHTIQRRNSSKTYNTHNRG